jgi:Cof subfamily protein (haloacid dehalogenase superfamily)
MDLYISDLDGTLFTPDERITPETAGIINSLIDTGLHFTVATARSSLVFMSMLASLNLRVPTIANNGVFVYDPVQKVNLLANYLSTGTATKVLDLFEKLHFNTLIYTHEPATDTYRIYYRDTDHYGVAYYVNNRLARGDHRFIHTANLHDALAQSIITILCINDYQKLLPIYDQLMQGGDLNCHFSEDIYSGAHWLEVAAPNADKKGGILFVKEYLQAERIICFGDNLNDLPMFEIADESYAMAGAHPDLKKIATGVIGANDADGVAHFLEKRFLP